MENIHCWQSKFELCQYSVKLLNSLLLLNKNVERKVDITKIKKAIYYAKKYHANQKRKSGEPYYSHPIEVAYMVANYTADELPQSFRTDIIITSLLHDCIEDTQMTKHTIDIIFNEKIANQVQDLTRIKPSGKISAAEMVNLLFLEKKHDLLIIKTFDRLHNMKTLYAKSPEKIKKTVEETLTHFIPLMIYLNLTAVGEELKQLCLQYSLPIKPNIEQNDIIKLSKLERGKAMFLDFRQQEVFE